MNKNADFRLILVLCGCVFFAVINSTMFNVAIPFIKGAYHLTSGQSSLITVVYLAVFSVGTMVYGKLADIFPLRQLYLLGLGMLIVGSLLGYSSSQYEFLLLARMIQACGAAAIPSLTMLAFNQFYSTKHRINSMVWMAACAAFGAGAGPVLGGMLTHCFGYKSLFLVSVIVMLMLPLIYNWMPPGGKKCGAVDWLGCGLFSVSIFLFIVGVSIDFGYMYLGLVGLCSFFLYSRRVLNPFIDLKLFGNKMFSMLLLVGMLLFLVSIGNLFLLPMLLKNVNGLSADVIGLSLLPGAVSGFFAGKFANVSCKRYGSLLTLSFIIMQMMLGFFLISTVVGKSYLLISGLAILPFMGFGAVQAVLGNYMFAVLPAKDMNVGMGIYNLCMFVGGALGPALSAKYLDLGWKPVLNIWNHASIFCDSFMLLVIISGISLGVLFLSSRQQFALALHSQ